MNNQLSTISTQYRKFSKGQYIEHTQFNEFLDFFEDQDRLSRVMLQGVGLACGFIPRLIYTNTTLNSIQLSQGAAITTDGDLLTLNTTSKASNDLYVNDLKKINIQNKLYTHFKMYDNYKVGYPAFHDNYGKQIELWELATSEEARTDFQPISSLENLEDKYLLLYLENYEKEIKPCRGVDCDNHGVALIQNLKVLVTTERGIEQILSKDNIYPNPMFSGLMIDKKLERVILNASSGLDTAAYANAVKKDNYANDVIFHNIEVICNILGLKSVDHSGFITKRNTLLEQDLYFQYGYDVMKDLIDTYNEIIRLLPKSFTKCLPDLLSFPKHIMLGKLIPHTKFDHTRHQFYNSPILDSEKITQKVNLLVARFNQQIAQFDFPTKGERNNEIRITPSQKSNPLGNKAIPFYYNLTEGLLEVWNFNKTSNRTSNTNLSFNTTILSGDEQIQNPVKYNIDKKPFYCIEGHQGTDYQSVVETINTIKNQQQLGFDVMALSLEQLTGNKDLSIAYFNDYVERNPGLEHTRGVARGGTFAVVYNSSDDPTVIADFSLPYVCCTPKPTIKLSLPSSVACPKENRILFTVSPINGVVKANVTEGLNGGVTFSNGQYFFNPSLVSPELYDQEIAFTVNGEATNCVITVISQPNIQVVVNTIHYPESGSNTTTVNFTVSGQNFIYYDYDWDFLDNGNYIPLNPDSNGNITYTYYNLDTNRIPKIKVQISGGGCSQNIALNDWYTHQSFTINNINFPDGNCCEDVNKPPVAIAGASQTSIQLPVNSITLTGASSNDSDGAIVSYSWMQKSSLAANITNPNTANTTVTGLVEGIYTFQLTVTDNYGATGTDEVIITVNKAIALPPSLNETVNTTTGPGGRRQQVFKVGPNVTAGNKFQTGVYSVVLTVIATASDTPNTIAIKMRDLINNTTSSHWNQFSVAPTTATGFPPQASASGDLLTINLNYQNQFFGSASVS